jgi:hypothetical protein
VSPYSPSLLPLFLSLFALFLSQSC